MNLAAKRICQLGRVVTGKTPSDQSTASSSAESIRSLRRPISNDDHVLLPDD